MIISDLNYLEVVSESEVVEGGAKKGYKLVGDININVGIINQIAVQNVLVLGKKLTTDVFLKQKAELNQ